MIANGLQSHHYELQTIRKPTLANLKKYCAISINSAGHVTRYMPAEILNSAHGGNDRYIHIFSADFYDFFAIFKAFFTTSFMVSALGQNDRYNRYISAFLERLLRVTAELIEMVQ